MKPPGRETRNDQFEQPLLSYSVRAFRLWTASSSASDLFISQLIIQFPITVPLLFHFEPAWLKREWRSQPPIPPPGPPFTEILADRSGLIFLRLFPLLSLLFIEALFLFRLDFAAYLSRILSSIYQRVLY